MASRKRDLTEYPRPSVAVDTAVLVVGDGPGRLDVLLHRRPREPFKDKWALPGTFLHGDDRTVEQRETLADAVLRSLQDKVGLVDTRPRQLHVFDAADRDDRGWVLSVAHVVLLLRASVESVVDKRPHDLDLQAADEISWLPFRQQEIVGLAVEHVRREHALRPDPFGVLADSFTLKRLHELHEAVARRPGEGEARPSFDTFRRYMLDNGLVERTGGIYRLPAGRPAHLYRRAEGALDPMRAVGVKPLRRARARIPVSDDRG